MPKYLSYDEHKMKTGTFSVSAFIFPDAVPSNEPLPVLSQQIFYHSDMFIFNPGFYRHERPSRPAME